MKLLRNIIIALAIILIYGCSNSTRLPEDMSFAEMVNEVKKKSIGAFSVIEDNYIIIYCFDDLRNECRLRIINSVKPYGFDEKLVKKDDKYEAEDNTIFYFEYDLENNRKLIWESEKGIQTIYKNEINLDDLIN